MSQRNLLNNYFPWFVPTPFHYQFWQHRETGEVFAAQLNPKGEPIGVAGPLVSEDTSHRKLQGYRYSIAQGEHRLLHRVGYDIR